MQIMDCAGNVKHQLIWVVELKTESVEAKARKVGFSRGDSSPFDSTTYPHNGTIVNRFSLLSSRPALSYSTTVAETTT